MSLHLPPARVALDRAMSEDDLLQLCVDAARLHGWAVHHDRRSDKALTMGLKGFPDLVLVGRKRVVFAELKTETGRMTAEQKLWSAMLLGAGADWRLWRPRDWPAIDHLLATGYDLEPETART